MNPEDILPHSILVAEKVYLPYLFAYKSEHPSLSFKILSAEDLLDRIHFSYKGDPIPFLLTQNVSYGNAKKILTLLRLSDFAKNEKLKGYYSLLKEQGYIAFDPLGEYEIKKSRLLLFEESENLALVKLLQRKGIPFSFVSFPDLGIQPKDPPEIVYFPNKLYQYCYIFSSIRKAIKEDPSVKDRVCLLTHDDSDLFYIQLCSKLFALPSCRNIRTPLLSYPAVKKKVSLIYQKRSFLFAEEEKEDPSLSDLRDVVDHYGLATLPFSFAYASLLEILFSLTLPEKGEPGINATDRYDFVPRALYYVTNFQHGDFYDVSSDKDVLSDEELERIDANPSYVKTKMDRRMKLNFILYLNIRLLSRPIQHLNDKIYDSPFLEELGWNKTNPSKKARWNQNGEYTSLADKLYRTDFLDQAFYRQNYEDLLGYDHSFHSGSRPFYPPVRVYSATKLERYISCPFKFLLDAYFPSDPSSIRTRSLGTLNHAVMTSLYSEKFDFDSVFSSAEEDYRAGFAKEGVAFSGEEEAALEVYKHWLRRVVSALRASVEDNEIFLPAEKAEEKVFFTVECDGMQRDFSGRIDKILFSGPKGQRYYTIIDYKSGAESFDAKKLMFGPSIQLPLYYLALQEEGNKKLLVDPIDGGKEPEFGGFLIQHCYFSTAKRMASDGDFYSYKALRKNVRGKGVSISAKEYWDGIDPEGVSKKGGKPNGKGKNLAKGLLFSSVDGLEPLSSRWRDYTFAKLIDDARLGAIATIENIEAGDFPIAPTSANLGDDSASLACSHCPYGDICYKNKAADAKDYSSAIRRHFGTGLVDAGEEGEEDDE